MIQSSLSRGVPWQRTVGAVVLAILVSFGVLALDHVNPFMAYGSLFSGAFLSPLAIGTTLVDSLPLMLVGIGVAISFQAGLVNIGGEAQYVFGAIAATVVGLAMPGLFGPAHIVLALAASMVAGALLGAVPGILKAYLNVSEIVSTLMLSYATIYFAHFLLEQGPLAVSQFLNQSANLAPPTYLPTLIPGTQLSWGLILAPIAAVGASWFLYRTRSGFSLRMMGQNPKAARYAGVPVGILTVLSLTIAGALGGLGGGVQILGNYHALFDTFTSNYGFTAFVVALMARNNPWGTLLVSLFFGAMQSGGAAMQATTGVPNAMVDVVEGLIIFFIAADRIVAWLVERNRNGVAPGAPAAEEAKP